jgi:hypothetical protein
MDHDHEEECIHDILRHLQDRYQRDAQPWIDMLVRIRSLRPPEPITMTREHAKDLGLISEEE